MSGIRSKKNGRFLPEEPKEYLYKNFEKNSVTGCWNWTGTIFQVSGYGAFKCLAMRKNHMNASRASWIIHNGPISSRKIMVCHTCDNRKCVNPDHLFLGSSSDNMIDASKKGRINHGEDRPQSKLTDATVAEARRLRQDGISWRNLAANYGVTLHCMISAITGKTWAHVKEPVPTYVGKPGRPKCA